MMGGMSLADQLKANAARMAAKKAPAPRKESSNLPPKELTIHEEALL
jgi:hypothetical protein